MPEIFRRLAQDLERSREALVPPAFAVLWEIARYIVLYGGRGAAKSWSIARVLLMLGYEAPLRVLICREILGSIRQSSYQLLRDQIELLGLVDFYDIGAETITGRNGTVFNFEGLKYNADKLRSYEGVDIVWVEEAQSVSELSWETLLPTIRKAGSRFVISFNPLTPDDPVFRRFVEHTPPRTVVRKVSWRDNPHMSAEAEADRAWLEKTDFDAYRHVWEGEPRTVSDALILRNKFAAEDFEVQPGWAGPYHGLDYGFSRDPSAGVRCYVDDTTRTLYIDRELWALGADIDALPGVLESAIPGISRYVVYADSARPESTSYLARNGIPNARSAEKWPGSVDDGIAYLRSFARIVIHPDCKHLLDECRSYSFKTDRLTGVPLPEPLDKNNHCIDALRYALSPLIRNQPTGGFFTRGALLEDGEPLEAPGPRAPVTRILMTAALCDRPGSALGVVFWAHWPHGNGVYPLRILDYAIAEVGEALTALWLHRVFEHAQQLRVQCRALEHATILWAEEGELHDALTGVASQVASALDGDPLFDVNRIDADKIPLTLDERASRARLLVNGAQFVKLTQPAYAQQVTHRSVTANHLLSQVLGYRPGAPDVSNELTNAFLVGCLIAHDERWQPAVELEDRAQISAPLPPPAPPPLPGLHLRAGRHIIDGIAVDIPGERGEMVWWPLSIGRHVIDSKIAYVHNPAAGIRIA